MPPSSTQRARTTTRDTSMNVIPDNVANKIDNAIATLERQYGLSQKLSWCWRREVGKTTFILEHQDENEPLVEIPARGFAAGFNRFLGRVQTVLEKQYGEKAAGRVA